MRQTSRTVAAAIGVVGIALVLLVPHTTGRGSEMDEGAVNAYAARILDGAVPTRDFWTLYPGNLWTIAGAFALFGQSVTTERMVGLVYRIVVVVSLFALGRRVGGLLGGVLAGIVAAAIMTGDQVWASAAYGGLAFGLVGLACGAAGGASASNRRRTLLYVVAGITSGMAILVRFDFAPAVLVSALPLLRFGERRGRLGYAAGLLATMVILVMHFVVVGGARLEHVVNDLRATGSGRSLPVPLLGTEVGRLLAGAVVATALLVVIGTIASWRARRDLQGAVILATGLFSAALVPWAISRADSYHVQPLAVVPLSLLPGLALYVVARARLSRSARRASVLVIAALAVVVLLGNFRTAAAEARHLRGIRGAYHGFYDGDRDPARAVVSRAAQLAKPGDSLFVGPQDLRRTNYGPTYMYFLLQQLRPASYYMEMNPLTANREGSGLADDLRRADWLILTSKWDNWNEPNASSTFGPSEPNQVVRDKFCLRFESGDYRLYERCDRAA